MRGQNCLRFFHAIFAKNREMHRAFIATWKEANPVVEFDKVNMDEFIAGCVQRFCPECGTEIRQKDTGRPRKFCSDPCRRKYWKAHPKPEQWDSYHEQVCPVCGRTFFAQHENKRERKYCCRACANKGRALKGEAYENSDT